MPDDQAPKGPDYRHTMFLPETDFPMRAGLPKKEPEILARWAGMDLYGRIRAASKGRPVFSYHDGPPYANAHIHIGTALNKILKDFVVRSQQMMGFDCNYVPGWDCHGLPIEWKVEQDFAGKGRKKADVPPSEFRKACRDYAMSWVEVQREEFKRLGIEGDWADPYLTMSPANEAGVVAEFLKFVEKGLVYRGSKPVMWSPVEQTALAEAEIEYHDHTSTTIWVRFPFRSGAPKGLEDATILIWTTTPWTIPGNRAVCYGPTLSYGAYRIDRVRDDVEFAPWTRAGEVVILADALAEEVQKAGLIAEWTRLADVDPASLAGAKLAHPLNGHAGGYEFDVPLLSGDHVTDDAGTGFVHTAPSHGQEDYFAWLAHGLPTDLIPHTVGPDGAYTDEAPGFTGEKVFVTEGKKKGQEGSAGKAVVAALLDKGALFARGRLVHSYPHSWRSKAPVLFRNTPQWFIRIGQIGEGGLRDTALKAIDETPFTPPSGRNRIRSMVEQRPDWLLSRQRAWGNPIALFVHRESGEVLFDAAVNDRIIASVREHGLDGWFEADPQDLLGPDYRADDYEMVRDILDVWFDSACSHAYVLEARPDLSWPADLYLEGSDQHRGWFQSSLLESCGTRGRAPYNAIVTHGFVLDAKGYKMSKSLGNTVAPHEVTDKFGADILRIWAAGSDYLEDVRIGDEILGSAVDAYRKLRNTLRYLLAALDGYTDEEAVPATERPSLERYILHRVHQVHAEIIGAYRAYDFKTAWRALTEFASGDLSALYFDVRKDSLYCDAPDDAGRRATRATMAEVLEYLVRWLAPIAPFTAEETYLARHPDQAVDGSVHLLTYETPDGAWADEALSAEWQKIRQVRRVVTGALEVERRERRIGASLEAKPTVWLSDEALAEAASRVDMAEVCITSAIDIQRGDGPAEAFRLHDRPGVAVLVAEAPGEKCARCWRVLPEVSEPDLLCDRCADVVTP